MAKLSREDARKFIVEIRESLGGITADARVILESIDLQGVLRSLTKMRKQFISAIRV